MLVVATVLSLPQALVVGHNIPVKYGAFYYLVLYMKSRGNNTNIDCYELWVVGADHPGRSGCWWLILIKITSTLLYYSCFAGPDFQTCVSYKNMAQFGNGDFKTWATFLQKVRVWTFGPARPNKRKFYQERTTPFLTKYPNTSEGGIILIGLWNLVGKEIKFWTTTGINGHQ